MAFVIFLHFLRQHDEKFHYITIGVFIIWSTEVIATTPSHQATGQLHWLSFHSHFSPFSWGTILVGFSPGLTFYSRLT